MDFFDATLTLSLAVCGGGLAWRAWHWLRFSLVRPAPGVRARLGGLLRVLASRLGNRDIWPTLLSLVKDVGLQLHLLRLSRPRWLMHACIFLGFMPLLLFHAMDGVVSRALWPGYEPTLDPWQMLRNLCGVLVLLGLGTALARRLHIKRLRRVSAGGDWFALALLAAIVGSGFVLEAVKILSPSVFERMVAVYLPVADEQEVEALQAYWAVKYGMVFPDAGPYPVELVAAGAEIDQYSCASCHSPTTSAFVSYPLSRALHGSAPWLDRIRADLIFWYLHFLLFFIGVAWLPFGKLRHVLTTPLQLLVRPKATQTPPSGGDPAVRDLARGFGLDACTHCGVCSVHCSVAPVFSVLGNVTILPSEKLRALRGLDAAGAGSTRSTALAVLAEGSFICTECFRCTELCPARIDLQDLWLASKQDLALREQAEPHGLMVRRTAAQWAAFFREFTPGREQAPLLGEPNRPLHLTDRRETFWPCIQCTTCTSVCPVVAVADDPVQELDLTPQQIMNLLRMGLKELALGSRMVWSCVTCYKCQENCPQGIKVADVLYELRNIAAERLRPGMKTNPWRIDPGEGA